MSEAVGSVGGAPGATASAPGAEGANGQGNAQGQSAAPAKEWKGFQVKQSGPEAKKAADKPVAGQSSAAKGSDTAARGSTQNASGRPGEPAKANDNTGKPAQAKAEAPKEDEFEELKIGSASGKVPKALATAIKELERGLQGKAQEAAMTRKQFEQFVGQAKQNPEWFFKQTGIDPDQFSQARLAEKLKREMMSPEQRKAMEQEQELSRYRQAEKETQEKQAKEKEEREFQELSQRVRQDALQAVGKSEEIRDDPYLVARVFAVKGAADEKNLAWDWEKCVDYVEKEQRASWTKRNSSLTPQQLEERLGTEVLSKWREHDLKRVTDKSALAGHSSSPHGRPGDSPASPRNEPKKGLSEEEYREYWKRLQG